MKSMGVTKKLFLLVAMLAAVALIVAGAMSWRMRSSTVASQARQQKSEARVDGLLALINQATRVQSTYQSVVRERDPDRLEALLAGVEKSTQECQLALERTGLDKGAVGERLAALGVAGGKVKEIVLRGEYAPAQQALIEESAPAFEALLGAITQAEKQAQEQSRAEMLIHAAASRSMELLLVGGAFTLIVVLVGFASIALRRVHVQLNDSVQELEQAATQMANAAEQVSDSSQVLARGASQQAASIEETTASSHELQSMTQSNSASAQSVSGLMLETAGIVGDANRKLEQLLNSMQAINASGGKISKIIKVIDSIAFQTNILALNAAVEAARAGEMGQGFAVVADEVRNLAQRSAQAAGDTTNLIQESIALSKEGGSRLDEVASVIARITEQASQAQVLSAQVSAGSGQQTQGIGQMATVLTQMQQSTQGTAAAAEQSAAAAEQMSAQCDAMRSIVDRLRSLVG